MLISYSSRSHSRDDCMPFRLMHYVTCWYVIDNRSGRRVRPCIDAITAIPHYIGILIIISELMPLTVPVIGRGIILVF